MNFLSRSLQYDATARALQTQKTHEIIAYSLDTSPSGRSIQVTWRRHSVEPPAGFNSKSAHSSTVPETLEFEKSLPENQGSTSRQRLESILLISREPVSPRKLAQLADLADATQARTLARQLNEVYDAGGHAFRIEEVAGGYMMLTRPQFASWLRKFERVKPEEHYSQNALETLAIVAYRQPVLRANIEAIRGVGCDEILRQLMERDLVRICGRSEELGRPYLYGTTKRFLQLFGLRTLDRLPRSDWVRQAEVQFQNQHSDNIQPSDSYSSEV